MSIFKKPVAVWNNQNFKVQGNEISFPVRLSGKSKRISIKTALTDYQTNLLRNKLGTLRITQKSGKYIAQIAVQIQEAEAVGTQIIGIDLGLKIPAVAVSQSGKVRFFGNGRQNKEQRWMKDQDHKISRQIVNFAKENHASVIRLEKLSGIRQTARTSRKNEKNLHSWSFYRLAQYIKYKAKLAGIAVVYVNPKYTSQTCPVCGKRNKANDRHCELSST